MRGEREEVGVAENRELCLEAQQVALGGSIELSLLGDSIAAVSFGDVTRDRERGEHDQVGCRLGFAPGDVANDAEHLAAQRDSLLPYFEIPNPGSHGGRMAAVEQGRSIYRMRLVAKRCPTRPLGTRARVGPMRPCENPCL